MKLNPNSTQPQISKHEVIHASEKSRQDIYEHPWYTHINNLNKPNPPTQQAVDKAKFIDKTFDWNRSSDNRPRGKRSTK